MVTVGLDLHKRYITACAIDDAGTVLAEARRLDPSLDALGRWLGALPQPLAIALEATLYWHWLQRQLTALGHRVVVAHPYQVKLIWQARAKTDPIDARKLAELARAYSGRFRPPVLIRFVHPFRWNPSTCSGPCRPPFRRNASTVPGNSSRVSW